MFSTSLLVQKMIEELNWDLQSIGNLKEEDLSWLDELRQVNDTNKKLVTSH